MGKCSAYHGIFPGRSMLSETVWDEVVFLAVDVNDETDQDSAGQEEETPDAGTDVGQDCHHLHINHLADTIQHMQCQVWPPLHYTLNCRAFLSAEGSLDL